MQGIRTLKKGLLKKVGYSVSAPAARRHAAVKMAVKKYGRASTIRKLNAVAVYTKRTSPAKSRKFKKDMKYAQKLKGGDRKEDLQTLKDELEEHENEGVGEMDPVPDALVEKARSLGLPVDDVGTLMNAIKAAFREELKKSS